MTFKYLLQIVILTYYLLSLWPLEHSSTNASVAQNLHLPKCEGVFKKVCKSTKFGKFYTNSHPISLTGFPRYGFTSIRIFLKLFLWFRCISLHLSWLEATIQDRKIFRDILLYIFSSETNACVPATQRCIISSSSWWERKTLICES